MNSKTKIINFLRWVGLLAVLIWSAFPILFLIMSSFKEAKDIFAFPPTFIFKPSLQNYTDLIREWPQFFGSLLNSLLITGAAAALTAIIATPAGYAFSRFSGKFFKGSAFFLLAARMFPPIVLTIPLFPVVNRLGLADTHWILIIMYATLFISMSSWLMKTFMDEIPYELEEAAMLDGASTLQTLIKVIFPLSIHGIITTLVFVSVFAWKEFTLAYIFTGTKARTAPIILNEMLGSVSGVQWGPLFAAATVQLVPILIFILAVQKYLVKGITGGSVKG